MKSDYAIKAIRGFGDLTVFEVDMAKANYHGKPWYSLSGWQKRKFENLVVISRPEHVKVIYS